MERVLLAKSYKILYNSQDKILGNLGERNMLMEMWGADGRSFSCILELSSSPGVLARGFIQIIGNVLGMELKVHL